MKTDSNAKKAFLNNLHEAILLLGLSVDEEAEKTRNALFKSSVVVSVSYWEKYVEDLLVEGGGFIAEGLRNPVDLPENTRQEIAMSSVKEKREVNPCLFSSSIWKFSGEGWADQYKNYINQIVKSFNTADSTNVKKAICDVFGVRNIFANWTSPDPSIPMNEVMLDKFIVRRHEIAHGSSAISFGKDTEFVFSSIKLLMNLVEHVEEVVWNQIGIIVQKSGLILGLRSKYILQIINHFKDNGFDPVTNRTFQKISTTANSNYKKLSYSPWNLLEIKSPKVIIPTSNMSEFISGKLSLPAQINVLKNQKALPKPNTHYLYYQDLVDYFSKPSAVS